MPEVVGSGWKLTPVTSGGDRNDEGPYPEENEVKGGGRDA